MNLILRPRALAVVLSSTLCAAAPLTAQTPPAVPAASRRLLLPPNNATNKPAEELHLKQNYRLVVSRTQADGSSVALSVLSCSPRPEITGPLDMAGKQGTIRIAGTLAESEEGLLFSYGLGMSIPMQQQEGNNPNIRYQDLSASGSLRMQPGKVYEVLKADGTTITLSLTPEPEAKK